MSKVLVLHSGGLDSTTCLYQAHAAGHETVSLGISYGQRLSIELLFAEQQCIKKNIERQVVDVRWTKPVRSIPLDRNAADVSKSVSTAFLPGRNIVFLALASAHGAGIGADEIWIGINSVEFSGYPDCTPEFLDAYSKLQRVGSPNGPKIVAPLLMKSKQEIAAIAYSLGISQGDTWSCYRPQIVDGGARPCGRCDACKLHEHAWQHVGT
jgi:7-cyano-7-deazaguanine synthase